LQYGEYLLVLL